MNRLLLASFIAFSINANANDGKYDDCIVVGEMATEFMTMMQDGLTLSQSLKKIKGAYTSDSGDDEGEKFAFDMMTRMYQQNSRVIGKKYQKESIVNYEKQMVRQCINSIDSRR